MLKKVLGKKGTKAKEPVAAAVRDELDISDRHRALLMGGEVPAPLAEDSRHSISSSVASSRSASMTSSTGPTSPQSRSIGASSPSSAVVAAAVSAPPATAGLLHVTVHGAKGLTTTAAYGVLEFDQHQVRNKALPGSSPQWNSKFIFDVTHSAELSFWLYDGRTTADSSGNDDVCFGTFNFKPYMDPTAKSEQWYPLRRVLPTDPKPKGEVLLSYSFTPKGNAKMRIEDFAILRVIGKGSFGKVMMVRKKDTGRVYAIKVLRKKYLLDRGEIQHTISERKILAKNSNPFLVALKFSFQTPDKVYFVLDYVNGGELFVHLQREECFSEERSRLYTMQLIMALDHLHSHSIVYRDLKPENILIDMNGYIKLTDFGLCKEEVPKDGKTNTFCGTPEYMAPEILQQKGYGIEVDWWTIGTLLFEMLTGLPPFYDENTQEMYQKILSAPLVFTEECGRQARSVITGLLNRKPADRLGRRSVNDIKEHPFFSCVNWEDLYNKKIKPPWRPRLQNALDTSNFDPEFTTLEPVDTPSKSSALRESVQEHFVGFTYVDERELI